MFNALGDNDHVILSGSQAVAVHKLASCHQSQVHSGGGTGLETKPTIVPGKHTGESTYPAEPFRMQLCLLTRHMENGCLKEKHTL